MKRLIAVAVPTIVSVFALGQPASAPPVGEDQQFYANARLDTSQVVDPGPCTLVTFKYDDWLWAYCEEDPDNVQPVIP